MEGQEVRRLRGVVRSKAVWLRSAMPAVHAERLCPEAIFVPPDLTRYKAASQSVREILQRHTDAIEAATLISALPVLAVLSVSRSQAQVPTPMLIIHPFSSGKSVTGFIARISTVSGT
jgi:impB/mucB/samB family